MGIGVSKMEESSYVNSTIHPEDKMFRFIRVRVTKMYINSGRKNTLVFRKLIAKFNSSLLSGKKVLDYGCGHGRMTRHMKNCFAPSILVAADVLESGVNFCAEEFSAIPFLISKNNSISKFHSKFDIIISVSVFSHLPLDLFESNMFELSRSLDKNGLLLFTANGEYFIKKYNLILKDGFYFGHLDPNLNLKKNYSLSEYGQTCVSFSFVESLLKRLNLQIINYIPQGHVERQDIFVVGHK